ncbi:hypothetical protein FGO68_gene2548 [Halteria grandinella]|uniref:Uncharacterized protein n=1 Tax=Halteria grandinella TaxID=5974 RepID=A0A8J8NFG3_HALGN|nr:hypothetical protein FGO68_gene2548 [Halteria grandinella]
MSLMSRGGAILNHCYRKEEIALGITHIKTTREGKLLQRGHPVGSYLRILGKYRHAYRERILGLNSMLRQSMKNKMRFCIIPMM